MPTFNPSVLMSRLPRKGSASCFALGPARGLCARCRNEEGVGGWVGGRVGTYPLQELRVGLAHLLEEVGMSHVVE